MDKSKSIEATGLYEEMAGSVQKEIVRQTETGMRLQTQDYRRLASLVNSEVGQVLGLDVWARAEQSARGQARDLEARVDEPVGRRGAGQALQYKPRTRACSRDKPSKASVNGVETEANIPSSRTTVTKASSSTALPALGVTGTPFTTASIQVRA